MHPMRGHCLAILRAWLRQRSCAGALNRLGMRGCAAGGIEGRDWACTRTDRAAEKGRVWLVMMVVEVTRIVAGGDGGGPFSA